MSKDINKLKKFIVELQNKLDKANTVKASAILVAKQDAEKSQAYQVASNKRFDNLAAKSSKEISDLKRSTISLEKLLDKANAGKASAILVSKQGATKVEKGVGKLLGKDFTNRENEIMNLISIGFTNYEISNKLNISKPTVKTHLRNIYLKSDIHDRANLAIRVLNSDKD